MWSWQIFLKGDVSMARYGNGPDPDDITYDSDIGAYVDSDGDTYYDEAGTESTVCEGR